MTLCGIASNRLSLWNTLYNRGWKVEPKETIDVKVGLLFLEIWRGVWVIVKLQWGGVRYWRYEGCLESIRPFWISRESVMWPWWNLAANKRRPYCTSVNSHSPVRLVSRQWDDVDLACVLCDRRIHKSPPFQQRFCFGKSQNSQGCKSGL